MLKRGCKIIFVVFVCVIGVTATSVSAFAQDQAPAPAQADKKKSPKSATINFEDQLVEGEAQKPELFYLLQKKQFNYKRLIRLREDFLPEMRKTSEDIQRRGSAD